MNANESYTIERQIGKRTYYALDKTKHDAYNILSSVILKHPDYAMIKQARIILMGVYPNISKTVVAQICKANRHIHMMNDIDYIIEVSGDTWDLLSHEVREILLLHEVFHIAPKITNAGISFRLRDHDFKDFKYIIDTYGTSWFDTTKSANGIAVGDIVDIKV